MEEKTRLAADEQFCFSCGEIIKKAAEICPKCGVRLQAPPEYSGKTSIWSKKKFYSWVITPLSIIILLMIWLDGEDFSSMTCESLIDDIVELSKGDDSGEIQAIDNVQQWSRSDQELLCLGDTQMSSGERESIHYHAQNVPAEDRILIGYETIPISMRTCESIIDKVVELSKKDAPWIHKIYNVEEWSRTDQKLLCIGIAQLSSGREFKIQFYVEFSSDKIWFGYEERSVGIIKIF